MRSSVFISSSPIRYKTPVFSSGQVQTNNGVASIASSSFSNTAGNTLIVLESNYTSGQVAISSISDTAGNTGWKKAGISLHIDGSHTYECWYASDILVSAGNTITVNFAASANTIKCFFAEFSNVKTTGFDLQSAISQDASGTSHTTSSISRISYPVELVVGIFVTSTTADTYTAQDCAQVAVDGGYAGSFYKVTSSYDTPTLTVSTASVNQQLMAAWSFIARKA